jgi:hypothetical protein
MRETIIHLNAGYFVRSCGSGMAFRWYLTAGAAVEEVDSSDPHTIPQHLPPFNSAQASNSW